MIIKKALAEAKTELGGNNVAEPEASADFLMRAVLGWNKAQLYANLEKEIRPVQLAKLKKLIKKRKKHEPVWQIVGAVDFWDLTFKVNKNVLVPRPETEFLVEEVIKSVKRNKNVRILDVGTGAGPIAVALAKELSGVQIFASDISTRALLIAKKNAKANGATNIKFKKSALFSAWKGQRFDIVCANLPYIPHDEMQTLALDVMHYEPRLALDGGNDGLEIYEEFLRQLPVHLEKGGRVFCEIGDRQGEQFQKLVRKYLPNAKCIIKKDLAALDRIAIIR